MPKVRTIQTSFSSGFLDDNLIGRIEVAQYQNGMRQAVNVLTLPQGPVRRRPGTTFIDELPEILVQDVTVPTMINGGVVADIIDDDPITFTTTTTDIGVLDPYVVAEYDLGAPVDVLFVDVIGISFDAVGVSNEFEVQWSSDGFTWNTLKAISNLTENLQDLRIDGVTAQYFRIARIGVTDLLTLKIQLSGFLIWTGGGVSAVRLIDFELSDTDFYLLAFTNRNIRIFKGSVKVADIGTTYVNIPDVNYSQADTAILFVHEDHPPARLIKGVTDADWSLTDLPFTTVTQFDYNDTLSPTPVDYVATLTFASFAEGDRFQIDIDGAETKSIAWSPIDATLKANMEREIAKLYILGGSGVTVSIAALVATITLSGDSAGAYETPVAYPTDAVDASAAIASVRTQAGTSRREDIWSALRGYPVTVAFYQSRLYFFGTKSKLQSLMGSRIGQFFDFDTGEGFDDDGIFLTLNTRARNSASAIVPARLLQLFTTRSEFSIAQLPVTPASVTPQTQTNHGTLGIDPVEIDGSTLFLERRGRTLREFLFNENEQAFTGASLSFMAQSLINSPVDMTALRGRTNDDSNYVFIVNTDGTMAVYNVLRSQGVGGFTQWTTSGLINAAQVLVDDLYLATKRTVDGKERQYLEILDEDVLLDSTLSKTQASSAIVTGLEHLEGLTVRVKADGAVLQNEIVAAGQITMERAGIAVEIGLDVVPIIQPMPITANGGPGPSQYDIKKVVESRLNVIDTLGLIVSINGVEEVRLPDRAFGDAGNTPLNTVPEPFTGIIPFIAESLGYADERLQSIVITQRDPVPMTIAGISYKVEVS